MSSDMWHLRHRYSQCGHWSHHRAQHWATGWQGGAWYCHCYCGQLEWQTLPITHSQCRHLLLRLPISCWSTLTTNTWLTWQWFSSQITPSSESEPSLSAHHVCVVQLTTYALSDFGSRLDIIERILAEVIHWWTSPSDARHCLATVSHWPAHWYHRPDLTLDRQLHLSPVMASLH